MTNIRRSWFRATAGAKYRIKPEEIYILSCGKDQDLTALKNKIGKPRSVAMPGCIRPTDTGLICFTSIKHTDLVAEIKAELNFALTNMIK